MSRMHKKPNRVVISLGGNEPGSTPEEQEAYFRSAAPFLLDAIDQGNEIIITHGNGPQAGMIQKAFTLAHQRNAEVPLVDLPECGAMSQGYIGYQLQQAIGAEMDKQYKRGHVATVVTQIEVDPDDPALANPSKPIGAYLTEEQMEADKALHPEASYRHIDERGWRRLAASPDPKKIVEADSILNLLDNDFVVIACGGGGLPVVRDYSDKGAYKGVPAVIEKDLAGELLAEDCHANVLLMITSVDFAYKNFGQPDQEGLRDLTVEEAERLADEGQFGATSMEPKVRAAVKFVRSRPGRTCVIASLEHAAEALAGLSGTRIHA